MQEKNQSNVSEPPTQSQQLYEKARKFFPGGVNSPARAFGPVGGQPLFIDRGAGCRIWDADGKEYIDFCCSFGPLILGHAYPPVISGIHEAALRGTSFGTPTRLENDLAALILENHRFIEKIRFVNSGTEAAMSAIRLARGYTGRNKVIKFEGCYHGHVDALMVKAGSGLATHGTSTSAGIPEAYTQETIVLPLHDKEAVREAVKLHGHDIACIALEPIPANNGLLLQGEDFLRFLRELCDEHDIPLFFDEVISGFRVGFEGAAGYYNIQPDIVAYGKIIGGGLPVGAYGASNEIMAYVSPDGPVYQAGTLSGNPVAMAAGLAQIRACLEPGFYERLEEKTERISSRLNSFAEGKNLPFRVFHIGSIFWLSFSRSKNISSVSEIAADSGHIFSGLHKAMLEKGVYLGPSAFEVCFVSQAHTDNDLDEAAGAFEEVLESLFSRAN